MYIRHILFAMAIAAACNATAQTITIEKTLLSDIEHGDPWPCVYYELNKNQELTPAETGKWYSMDEDESYWQTGVGPFSNDPNKFFITDWASELHPLLVRRHFTLTAEDIAYMPDATVTMRCSYDENPVIYINGTRLVAYTGWNDNDYASYTFTKSKRNLFVEGDNVLAISVKQGGGGGHIDCSLTMKVKVDPDRIAAPTAADEIHQPIYNISGQPVRTGTMPKGLYIVNGEKKMHATTR